MNHFTDNQRVIANDTLAAEGNPCLRAVFFLILQSVAGQKLIERIYAAIKR